MNRRTSITWGVSLGLLVGLWDGAAPSSATAATGNPGWISSVSASHAQNHLATLTLPSTFSAADLLVAVVITIAAWTNGQLGNIATLDGLNNRPERQSMVLSGAGSSIYAALFNGRKNATFTPLSGYHTAAARRAGDDTAQVIASNDRALGAGLQSIGYTSSPSPGDYWEEAVVEVRPAR